MSIVYIILKGKKAQKYNLQKLVIYKNAGKTNKNGLISLKSVKTVTLLLNQRCKFGGGTKGTVTFTIAWWNL